MYSVDTAFPGLFQCFSRAYIGGDHEFLDKLMCLFLMMLGNADRPTCLIKLDPGFAEIRLVSTRMVSDCVEGYKITGAWTPHNPHGHRTFTAGYKAGEGRAVGLTFTGITLSANNQNHSPHRPNNQNSGIAIPHAWHGRARSARNASASEHSGVARGRSPSFRKFWPADAGQLKICNACCMLPSWSAPTAADQHQVNDGRLDVVRTKDPASPHPFSTFRYANMTLQAWHIRMPQLLQRTAKVLRDEDARGEPAAG